ncbi:MAG TPA: family 78 glycoside hydrolase catalytic domain, partial [Opitutus sp.]|nr:family 78 glycoside hydrolase catalytic domain [Opitutus sp.]
LLKAGRNVLAAEVRWFGEHSPASEVHSPVPGWLVQGADGAELDTPGDWRVIASTGVTPDTTAYISNAHQFLGYLEHVDLRAELLGWRERDFDDSGWARAVSYGPARATEALWGVAPLRTLVPRDVPAMTELPGRFVRTIEARRLVPHRFGERPLRWTVAAESGGSILLEAESYETAFAEFEFSGGEGREVRITYAEALGEWIDEAGGRVWRKGAVRDDFTRYEAHGYRDTLILRGGEQTWEPFHWRAFRFMRIDVRAGAEPVTLRDVRYRTCVHPQVFSARFDASDEQARRIFDVSVRTFRMGAHEIYDDSPYYEQLSYTADTRLEALASLHLCNETALPRRTLRLFLDTLRPDGLLDARVPCQFARQTIPYFCLHWILMV